MSSIVLRVTENQALLKSAKYNTTTIMGIQTYLTDYLKNDVHGVSSSLYQLSQIFWFGSFILLFALTFLYIFIFLGFWSEYNYAKSRKWLFSYSKSHIWFFHYANNGKVIKNTVFRVIGIIVMVLIVYLLFLF